MGVLGIASIIFLLSSVLVFLLLYIFVRFINDSWRTPIRKQRMMRRQGIKGRSYSFPHGDAKEIRKMTMESVSRPMDLSSHNIFPRLQPHLYSWLNIYGKNFLNWFGPRANFVVTDVQFIKEIFNRDEAYPKADMEGYGKMLLGDGLVSSKGEKWAKQRKLANHAFHAESLKSMTPAMVASVEMMLERWRPYEGKEIEVFEQFRLLTSDIISRTAFGSSYLEGEAIFKMLVKLGMIISTSSFKIKLPVLSRLFKSKDDIEAEKLEEGIHDSIFRIMEKREEACSMTGGGGSFGTDFLGLLVKSKNDPNTKNRITVQDVVDECKTFYFAGHETTTSLLSWIVFLLGIHTDWQEKARQEVLKIFDQGKPNSDGLPKLKMMNMIINETLRLYPPVLSLIREVKEETTLGNFQLPANIHIVAPTLALHHDKQIWGQDTHLFRPERFSQGVAKATNNNPAVFIPFGLGPRSCVGLNFATNEAKIALSMILQRYSFTLSPAYIHSPAQILTVRPQHGIQVMLHRL